MIRQSFLTRLLSALTALALLAGCVQAVTPPPTAAPTAVPPTVAPLPTLPPPTTAPTAVPESPLKAAADQLLQSLSKAGSFSGSALIAQKGQVILSQGYGYADRAKQTPNTPQTKIRIGQMTQAFTAMAILILQERGKLNAQDKLCTYLRDCPATWQPLTLHHLLTHTSGIPNIDPWSEMPLDRMIAHVKTQPLDFAPGSQFGRSDTDYDLLGQVIEAVSGQSYETFLQQNIFQPLQMLNTGYDHNQADLASGYSGSGNSAAGLYDPQALYASAALYSTVEDLYLWDQALYTHMLVSQKALDSMFTGTVQVPDYGDGWNSGYGYVIGPPNPRVIEGAGYINGFSSVVHRWPDEVITIIILSNQQYAAPWDIAASLEQKLFVR